MSARFWRSIWRICFNLEIWAMNRWEKADPEAAQAEEAKHQADQQHKEA